MAYVKAVRISGGSALGCCPLLGPSSHLARWRVVRHMLTCQLRAKTPLCSQVAPGGGQALHDKRFHAALLATLSRLLLRHPAPSAPVLRCRRV